MSQWTPRHRDFLARSLMDFAKAMFAVGLASYFFREFPVTLRIGCAISLIALFVGSLAPYPTRKPED